MTSVVDIHKKKGVRPEFDVYIGRRIKWHKYTEDLKGYWYKDSKWANPYTLKKHGKKALVLYFRYIIQKIEDYPEKYDLYELKGKRLGDWCLTTSEIPDKIEDMVCHGQVLMKLLKEREEEDKRLILHGYTHVRDKKIGLLKWMEGEKR